MLWNEDQLPGAKKGNKACVERKESVFSGKRMDNVPKASHVVSVMTPSLRKQG